MPSPPLVLLWRVTTACDLGCLFCAYSRDLHRPRTAANVDDVLRLGAVLGEYARTCRRDILVSWLGGEPLRWKPIWEVSSAFREKFGLRVSATTNGTMLGSEGVRQRIVEDFDQLTVSIDGVGSFHDQRRSAPGLFAKLGEDVRRLHALKRRYGRGPRLRVNTILMRDTIYSFETLCRTVAEWGIEELTFNALGGRDRPEFFPAHGLRTAEVNWLRGALPGIRERLAQWGLTILGSECYLSRLDSSAAGRPIAVDDCQPGQTFLFIDEQGWIAPCSYTTQGYGIHLADIRTVDDFHQLPARFAERRRNEKLTFCFDCQSTQVFGKFGL